MENKELLEIEVLDYLSEENLLIEDKALNSYINYLAKNCEELNNDIARELDNNLNNCDEVEENYYNILTELISGEYLDKEDINFLGNIETENFISFFMETEKYGISYLEYLDIKNIIEIYGRDKIVKKVLKLALTN